MKELRPPFKELTKEKDLVGAEIGVSRGKNALSILSNLNIKRLYLIDIYQEYTEKGKGVMSESDRKECLGDAYSKLAGFYDKIVWIMALSEDAVYCIHEWLDFVYIDASHRYDYVKRDIELYYPLVKPGGIISGHDYGHDNGVAKAVHEFFGKDVNVKGVNWWKRR